MEGLKPEEQHVEHHDPAIEAGAAFLSALFSESDTILFRPIETWVEAGKKRSRVDYRNTCYCKAVPRILKTALRQLLRLAEQEPLNLFFGVCPRVGDRGRFDLAWQIRTIRTLWADIDHVTVEEACQRVVDTGLPLPSLIVNSGNGVHLYWLLDEPYLIDDAGDPPEVLTDWVAINGKNRPVHYFIDPYGDKVWLEDCTTGRSIPANRPALSPKASHVQDVLKGIAAKIGGDHTTDLARLLRLPGTWNRKDQRNGRQPVLSEIIHQCDARYSFDQFSALAEASLDKQRRKKLETVLLPLPRKISPSRQNKLNEYINRCALTPPGERSEADFALCCHSVEHGIAVETIWLQVQGVGKFGERGREYFDRTWSKAEERTREKIYANLDRPATKPSASGKASPDYSPTRN